jgi:hypothetical protein
LSTTDATRALGSTVPKATAVPDFLTIAFISTQRTQPTYAICLRRKKKHKAVTSARKKICKNIGKNKIVTQEQTIQNTKVAKKIDFQVSADFLVSNLGLTAPFMFPPLCFPPDL